MQHKAIDTVLAEVKGWRAKWSVQKSFDLSAASQVGIFLNLCSELHEECLAGVTAVVIAVVYHSKVLIAMHGLVCIHKSFTMTFLCE